MLTSRVNSPTTSRATGRARTRTALLAGAALAAAAVLGGCAGTPGAAAVVDGRAIPASDVQIAVEQIGGLFQGVSTQTVTSVLIQEPVIVELAADNGVGVSDTQARDLLRSAATASGTTLPEDLAPATIAVARYVQASGALRDAQNAPELAQEFSDRLAELDIEVNPRFGVLLPDANIEAPPVREWIVGADGS